MLRLVATILTVNDDVRRVVIVQVGEFVVAERVRASGVQKGTFLERSLTLLGYPPE